MINQKLGLTGSESEHNKSLIKELLSVLFFCQRRYDDLFFRRLAMLDIQEEP
jgi:hypothetical protein